YITGYQQEFWDGSQWQTPFDDEKAILIAPEELEKIAIGASKLADDGTVVINTDKQAALEKAANKVTPSAEQMLLAKLTLEVAQMKAVKSSD
ncbi:phage infection protein, partial [Lacticaseibacillus rhamnosus]|uniref:phage infection protein n=1 Tax=Lacticaseibacillus rhamnosus TaxID=47715 RepID=UPI001013C578